VTFKRAEAVEQLEDAYWVQLRQAGHALRLHAITHLDQYLPLRTSRGFDHGTQSHRRDRKTLAIGMHGPKIFYGGAMMNEAKTWRVPTHLPGLVILLGLCYADLRADNMTYQ
jgi:hypothetical protein